MSIAGNLNTMPLAELLQWLSQSSKTGALVINNGHVEKKVFFKNGRVFSSASTDPKEYLGHFLVSHGLISEFELSKAIEMQESNSMLLGKILVTIGAVSEPDLARLLRLKAEESIYDTFSWEEAEFRFFDGELPASELIPLDLDVTAIVLEGARRADEWVRIQEVVPALNAIPVAVGNVLEDTSLDPGARQILALVNDDRTVEEICVETHSSEYRTSSVLYDQVMKGRMKIVRPRWASPTPQPAHSNGKVDAERLVEEAQKLLEHRNYVTALRYLRAARSLEPNSKGIQKRAEVSEEEIRDAVEADGVRLDSTPELSVDMADITQLDITPQEGFILTRINGSYDLSSILKISPMQRLDGMVVVWKLLKAGHIRLA